MWWVQLCRLQKVIMTNLLKPRDDIRMMETLGMQLQRKILFGLPRDPSSTTLLVETVTNATGWQTILTCWTHCWRTYFSRVFTARPGQSQSKSEAGQCFIYPYIMLPDKPQKLSQQSLPCQLQVSSWAQVRFPCEFKRAVHSTQKSLAFCSSEHRSPLRLWHVTP